jgi:hypothetical protein
MMLTFVGVLVAGYFGLSDAAHRVGTTFLKVGETIPKSPFFTGYVPTLLVSVAILPWAWRQAWLRRPATVAWALVAVCAFVTLHFRHGMYLETRFDFYTRNPKSRTDLRHLKSPALDAVRVGSKEPARVVGLDWEMVPGFSGVLGFETISGPDALMNPAMMRLVDALGFKRIWDWRIKVKEEEFASVHRALDMLNVRYVLRAPDEDGYVPPGSKVICNFDLNVIESETAWPRAFFTDTVGTFNSGLELRRLVEQGDGRPFAVQSGAIRAQLHLAKQDLAQRVVQPAQNYRLTNNTTTFEIEAPTPGMAVLMEAGETSDTLASVDGKPAWVMPINHAFRGVYIAQPGRHVVKFEYWPAVLDRALNYLFAGLGALALSIFWWWRTGRTAPKVKLVAPAPAELVPAS